MHFLKRPSEEYRNDLVAIESLRKEFVIGYALDHPNIPKYYRFENDTLFEEYIDGKSLRELIDENDPRLVDKYFLRSLCLQFIEVLRYLRDMGVVHNDIKPENIIVTRIGNTLKLIDFNCAQSAENELLGGYSAPYKSPEQGLGLTDSTSDLYQAGKVMELLCNRAGYNKPWRRFLAATTDRNIEKRVSLENAVKLIPGGQHKSNRLFWAIIPLMILGAIAVILFASKPTEPVAEEKYNPTKDTVVIEKISHPAIEITEKPESNRQEISNKGDAKKVIDKKILDFTDRYYTSYLYPICRDALGGDAGRLTAEEDRALQRAIEQAYRAAGDYGTRLASEYPEERNYIEKECLSIMEMKVSALMLKLYPPALDRPSESGE